MMSCKWEFSMESECDKSRTISIQATTTKVNVVKLDSQAISIASPIQHAREGRHRDSGGPLVSEANRSN